MPHTEVPLAEIGRAILPRRALVVALERPCAVEDRTAALQHEADGIEASRLLEPIEPADDALVQVAQLLPADAEPGSRVGLAERQVAVMQVEPVRRKVADRVLLFSPCSNVLHQHGGAEPFVVRGLHPEARAMAHEVVLAASTKITPIVVVVTKAVLQARHDAHVAADVEAELFVILLGRRSFRSVFRAVRCIGRIVGGTSSAIAVAGATTVAATLLTAVLDRLGGLRMRHRRRQHQGEQAWDCEPHVSTADPDMPRAALIPPCSPPARCAADRLEARVR